MTLFLSIIFLLLLFEAFFAATEVAFISASRARLLKKARSEDISAIKAKTLLSSPETLFSTTVLGTTLCMTAITSIATLYWLKTNSKHGEWMNILLLTPCILIFGEFIPKTLARYYADRFILWVARPFTVVHFVLSPITKITTLYSVLLERAFGQDSKKGFFLSREELKALLPESHGSDVTSAERELIERILEFGKTTVKEMQRPLIEVVAIEKTKTVEDAIHEISDSSHSRLPVYDERIDNIVGVIQSIDCIQAIDLKSKVEDIARPPLFVPESMTLEELLPELRSHPMAIVVNEFGGADGFITMEDVVEEIVGEIEDEFDEPLKLYRQVGEKAFIVNARIETDALFESLNIEIPKDDDYQTLAGFLLKKMKKIPKKWDSITIDGIEYVVQSTTDRSIEEVYIVNKNK